jgi:molecular chaperone DnaK
VPPVSVTTGPTATPSPAKPADELCTKEIMSNPRWVCLTSAVVADGKFTIKYDYDYDGSTPSVSKGYHVHFYGSDDGKNPPGHLMGSHVPKSKNKYYWDDREPSILPTDDKRYTGAIGDAEKVCARIAIAGHGLVRDNKSGYNTGNCVPITRPY